MPVFGALGDQTRLRLPVRLGLEGPLSISRLSDGAGVTRQAVTKHLQVLADAGLECRSRKGREQLWHVEERPLDEAVPRDLTAYTYGCNFDEGQDGCH